MERILVVDDNIDNVELLAKRFKALGYDVDRAYDGEEAIRKVSSTEPDIVILDVMMPNIDGLEVCQRIKKNPKTRSIPVILLTAKKETTDKVKGLDIGADDYVTKPFDSQELVARVKGLLTKKTSQKKIATEEKLGALGQMAEGVAHEVRNPMVSIGGFARRIRNSLEPGDKLRQYSEHIIKEVERLERMVEEIIRFKTIMIATFEEVDLAEIVDTAVKSLDELIAETGAKVKVKVERGLPSVQGDRGNLLTALENLIENAIESLPDDGGTVLVNCYPESDSVHILVADDGVGIPKENLANVFDPFYTSKMAGAGVGLTMVHRVISRHGGDVEIRSKVGEGTRVIVRLPLTQPETI